MSVAMRMDVDMSGWEDPLRRAAERVRDFRPAHRAIGELLLGEVGENFRNEGYPPGSWPDLSEVALLARARGRGGMRKILKGGVGGRGRQLTAEAQRAIEGAKPLVWSGRLLRSMTHHAGAAYVDVGTNLVQAARLFFGWDGPGPKTPARNPFNFSPAVMESAKRHYVEFLRGLL